MYKRQGLINQYSTVYCNGVYNYFKDYHPRCTRHGHSGNIDVVTDIKWRDVYKRQLLHPHGSAGEPHRTAAGTFCVIKLEKTKKTCANA